MADTNAMMITPDYPRLMARYSRWQNESLFSAANGLGDAARRHDRGAFFRSIHETLAHILWADALWLSRFGACAAPDGGITESAHRYPAWEALTDARQSMDAVMSDWAEALTADDLGGDLEWFSGALGRTVTRPKALLIAHLFNHATHHRGQAHAMITAAGGTPDDTDLPFMPGL